MVTYSTDELIPSSVFAKQFGSYLTQIRESAVEKLAILKNNKVEAVLISKNEYERMKMALDERENQDIIDIVEKRLSKPYKTISFKEMAKKHNIDIDEI